MKSESSVWFLCYTNTNSDISDLLKHTMLFLLHISLFLDMFAKTKCKGCIGLTNSLSITYLETTLRFIFQKLNIVKYFDVVFIQ